MDSRQKPNDKTVHTFTTIAWHSESPTTSSSHAQLSSHLFRGSKL